MNAAPKRLILKLRGITKNVIVPELYSECNSCERGNVWLIIRHEVYEYDTMVLNCLILELEYDLVSCRVRY